MTGWLPRSLVTMAVGGIVAFGVTVRVAHVDIQEAGAIVFFAGLLYLLVHLGLYGWERGWGTPRSQPDSPAAPAYDVEPSPRMRPRDPYPPPYPTREPRRDDDHTRVMPALDDDPDATAPMRRERRRDDRA